MQYFKSTQPFRLECGSVLPELQIAYHTFGTLNTDKSNVVWVAHALTANARPDDWWKGLTGSGRILDPRKYFIVCANMLGSCYGSTFAKSINPATDEIYGKSFPLITVRDMVNAHILLRKHLNISKIHLGIGGSMGGQQILEWSVSEPEIFDNLCLLATNARHSPWGKAFNEAQRMALTADTTLYKADPQAGQKGLEAARAVAMLSYRNYTAYDRTQQDTNRDLLQDYRATTYQQYQGLKLRKRFDPLAYLTLSRAMDSHDTGRGRGSTEAALARIRARTLVIGIRGDLLFPTAEQEYLAEHIPDADLHLIESPYGHDGFLLEYEKITGLLRRFLPAKTAGYAPESPCTC